MVSVIPGQSVEERITAFGVIAGRTHRCSAALPALKLLTPGTTAGWRASEFLQAPSPWSVDQRITAVEDGDCLACGHRRPDSRQ